MCEKGWYSGGDFHPEEAGSTQCDQNTNVIRGFGIMIAILAGFASVIKMRFTYLRYIHPMSQKYVQQVQCLYGLANVVYEFGFFIYGVLKAIDPGQYQIGSYKNGGIDVVNLFITISFFSLMYCASLNLSTFLEGTMKIFSSHGPKYDRIMFIISCIKRYGVAFPIIGSIISIFPFFDLSASSGIMSNQYIFNTTFLIGYYVVMEIQGFVIVALLSLVTEETGSYLADQAKANVVNETVTKIKGIDATLRLQWGMTTTRVLISQSWIVFASWPFLRQKFTYFYCIQYLFTYFTGLISLKSLWNFPRSNAGGGSAAAHATVPDAKYQHKPVSSIQVAPAPPIVDANDHNAVEKNHENV